jgi:signal peptidase I
MEPQRPFLKSNTPASTSAEPRALCVPESEVQAPTAAPAHPLALDAKEQELVTRLAWSDAMTWQNPQLAVLLKARPELPTTYAGFVERLVSLTWLPARLFACGWLAYLLIFNLSVVRGSSMAPGIHDGDRIMVDQFSYLFTNISRGDIVVLRYPLDPRLDYIKRVVGLPGDVITMTEGKLWINGLLYEEDYTLEQDPHTRMTQVVKNGHYFVLGDNRLHSSDSREFGLVAADFVRGKVDLRLWPLGRIGLLD